MSVKMPGKINHFDKVSAPLQVNYTLCALTADKWTSLCCPGLLHPTLFYTEEQVHSPWKVLRVIKKSSCPEKLLFLNCKTHKGIENLSEFF